jgi:hypothetical protein
MNVVQQQNSKKVFVLAIASVIASMLFSFLSAPFLRAFAVSTGSKVFWSVGALFVTTLFVLGLHDTQISQAAVYVGAIWMTLGSYSELEKRGINWKQAGSVSLLLGIVFASIGYAYLSQHAGSEILNQIVEPIHESLKTAFPDKPVEIALIKAVLPGIFVASLFGALAFGFLLESRVVKMFGIQKFKVASSLKWLEFRLPDLFIWVSLFSLLFSVVNLGNNLLQMISINFLIVSSVAYLVQGLIVTEFMMRFLRFGPISRTITYLFIFFQLAPFVVFIGLIDYWADFRKLVRRKAKQKTTTDQ